MRLNLILACLCFVMCSCSNTKSNDKNNIVSQTTNKKTNKSGNQQGVYNYEGDVVCLKEENLPPLEYFTLEEVELDNTSKTYSYVYNDKFIIKCQRNCSPLVSILDYHTRKEIAHYFNRGDGPQELLCPYAILRGDRIIIYDMMLRRIASLSPDLVLKEKNNYKPRMTYLKSSMLQFFDFLDQDTVLIYNNMYKEGFDVGENVPEFLLVDANSGNQINEAFETNGKFFPMNVTGGEIIKCPQSDYVYVAYQDEPRIKIMDNNLKTVKTILGPEENDMEYVVNGFEFHHDRERSSMFYSSSNTTKNYCVLINDRAYKIEGKEARDWLTPSSRQEIWVMNSDGEILRRLKQKDSSKAKKMFLISYCEENDTFHVNAGDEDDEYCLYKCVLER